MKTLTCDNCGKTAVLADDCDTIPPGWLAIMVMLDDVKDKLVFCSEKCWVHGMMSKLSKLAP